GFKLKFGAKRHEKTFYTTLFSNIYYTLRTNLYFDTGGGVLLMRGARYSKLRFRSGMQMGDWRKLS
ncbi:MAG: hypothetical protein ACOYOO_00610, partial [Saprospiraceae bacterium]